MSTPGEQLNAAERFERHAQSIVLEILGHEKLCALRIVYQDGVCYCGCPLFLRHWWANSWRIRREGQR